MTDAAEKKPRKPRAKKVATADSVVAAVSASITAAGEDMDSVSVAPPAEDMAHTHTFAYGDSRYATCACGAQNDLRLIEGKTVRYYRLPGGQWLTKVALCPNYVAPPPPVEKAKPEPVKRLTREERQARRERLAKANPDLAGAFDAEVINGCDVEEAADDVDLSIVFSPVLPRALPRSAGGIYGPGCSLEEQQHAAMVPVEVADLGEGRYRVYGSRHGVHSGIMGCPDQCEVDADELRVMRARFLLQRGALTRQLPKLGKEARERWMKLYHLTWMPPEGSPLANQVQTGEVITIARHGDEPVDFLAVMNALSTPGAALPDTCPVIDTNPEQL